MLATAWRFTRVGLHMGWGWFQLATLLRRAPEEHRKRAAQAWSARLLALCRVTVELEGSRPNAPVLLVSNHVSWLDMVLIQALCPSRFIAKTEVRRWPLIGPMAMHLGTVFVQRGSARSAARVARELSQLVTRHTVTLFPEGTTTDGTRVAPFQAALLQAPIDAGALVQPVALSYLEAGGRQHCRRAAYCDEDGLVQTIWRTLARGVHVRIAFGEPVDAQAHQRRALALHLHDRVSALRR